MNETIHSSTPVPAGVPHLQGAEPKPAFVEPKLTFIEPKLTPRGDLRDVTAGFFTSFSP
jgi:hypothetical protein